MSRADRFLWQCSAGAAILLCGGSLVTSAFAQGHCLQYAAKDTPKPVPDRGFVHSFMNVDYGAPITAVRVVNLRGTHPSVGDLRFDLVSPRNTVVPIVDGVCAGQSNFDLALDDAAPTAIPCPPTDGLPHVPSDTLSAFSGEYSVGQWELHVVNLGGSPLGSLDSWTLEICTQGFVSPALDARRYQSSLVPAMDQCTAGVLNIGGLRGCSPSNVTTDGTPFTRGKIIVRFGASEARVLTSLKSSTASVPRALADKELQVHLTVRATTGGSATSLPVAFVDYTLACPVEVVPARGDFVQVVKLSDCNPPAALAAGSVSKEIVGAAVVDAQTGKVLAVPGIRGYIPW